MDSIRKHLNILYNGAGCFVPVKKDWNILPFRTDYAFPAVSTRNILSLSRKLGYSSIFVETHYDYGISSVNDINIKGENFIQTCNSQDIQEESNRIYEFSSSESLDTCIDDLVLKSTGWYCNLLIATQNFDLIVLATHDEFGVALGKESNIEYVFMKSMGQLISDFEVYAEDVQAILKSPALLLNSAKNYSTKVPNSLLNLLAK